MKQHALCTLALTFWGVAVTCVGWALQQPLDASVRFREALAIRAESSDSSLELQLILSAQEALPQMRQCQAGQCFTFIPTSAQMKKLSLKLSNHSLVSMQVSYF